MKRHLNRSSVFFLILTGILSYLHFKNGLDRNFINYDDLDVVSPLFKLNFEGYFFDWLPDRKHYAFPLRDLTLFIDHWLGGDNNSILWISNFFYFTISAFFFALSIQLLMPKSPLLNAVLLSIFMLHPFQTEVIEWITCRKYLAGGVPIALGTYLIVRWRESGLSPKKTTALIGLWLLSLLSYPTGVLWIFWAIYYLKRRLEFKTYVRLYLGLAVISFIYLWLISRNTSEINSSLVNIIPLFGKSFHYAYNALGRGFFNLIIPFWTFPYYKENHEFTFVGLFLLVIIGLALFKYVYFKVKKSKNRLASGYLKECIIWFCGGLIFFIPTVNTILGFFDFMLADRHFFFSTPFFIIALGYLLQTLHEIFSPYSKYVRVGLLALVGCWLTASGVSIFSKAPLWHDDFLLMKDCALSEKSPRCYSQTIRRRFFKGDCTGLKTIILEAAEAYKDHPPYSLEYTSEVPFFHASCIALNLNISREKKAEFIEHLQEFYGPSPEIIFGLVLSNLERGQLDQAFNQANQYYLSDLTKGPISATRAIQSIYLGQIAALCSLKPSPLCKDRFERFQTMHREAELNSYGGSWGKEATLIMARRGSLIP
ncbi:MAG: hypothetical protein EXR74_08870 [Bdellovibrionales bacterium]|nr:hypothetical protein [Bdellovibrionales bacterium]